MRIKSTKGLPWPDARTDKEVAKLAEPFAAKLSWFLSKGYEPHLYQLLFHTMRNPAMPRVQRFRHLVAGRRGGKTLSAAWEVAYYSTHPAQFWMDFHGEDSDEPLWIWALSKDYKVGRPALLTFIKVLRKAGMQAGRDFQYNKTEKVFEFPDGTLVEFKSADDPESLRGAGLDILWIDETASIRDAHAYNVVYPSLSDKKGGVISTTTPKGKNWIYEEFWSPKAMKDPSIGSVEYRSVDSPYFDKEEWEDARRRYHPLLFKQEYEAMFDSMAGVELSGEWLNYYVNREIPRVAGSKKWDLDLFMGVDPAISLSDSADRFAMALIGVTPDRSKVYLLRTFAGRIPFPEQVDKVTEWHTRFKPKIIGIEAQAYQRALVQQLERNVVMLPVMPILNATKKVERIMSMAPLFKLGRILIHAEMSDFIDEWLNYDSQLKNPKDDMLDAVEIALRAAGALLPTKGVLPDEDKPIGSIQELARRELAAIGNRESPYDDQMGADY